jgi:hypothetical protein
MYHVQSRRRMRAGCAIARSLVLAGTMAAPGFAAAADLSVTNTRTEPVSTSNASGGAGNVTIEGNGAVSVASGTAITVDSSNKVTNGGRIESSSGANGRGVVITGGALSSTITNNGTIQLLADSKTDTVDQLNYGILLDSSASMTGDIINSSGATITVDGLNSVGILTRGSLIGNLRNQGAIKAQGTGSIGVLISGNVTGAVSNSGTINTGTAATQTRDNKGDIVTIPETVGGQGLAVGGSVSGGVLNDGDKLTAEEEKSLTDGDVESIRGLKKDAVGTDGSITVVGGANALHVGPDAGGVAGGNITIGPVGTEAYGVINRGDLESNSQTDGRAVETVRIGLGAGASTSGTTTVVGGFLNDGGNITATGVKGNATTLAIGSGAVLPEVRNVGSMVATTDTADATGLVIEVGATLEKVTNSGTLTAESTSVGGDAIAIIDRSGTLVTIENTGTIEAIETSGLDVEGARITTPGLAIDISTAAKDATILNKGTITGDVALGGGADTLTVDGGSLTGDVDFGAGDNTFTLSNKGEFTGDLTATGGNVDLVVTGSTFAITSEAGAQVRDASFDKDSTLVVPIFGSDAIAGTLTASGTVTFATGASLVTDFKTLSSEDITFTLVDAATLTFESDLAGLKVSDTSAFFDIDVALAQDNANKIVVTVHRATAEDLGLTPNQTAVFNVSGGVLEADTQLGAAMANLKTKEEVQDAFNQLMPDNSGATQQGIFSTQAAIFGAINSRMDGIYKLDQRYKERVQRIVGKDPKRAKKMSRRDEPTIWAQQLVFVANQSPYGQQLGYGGYSYGIALGADYPLFGLDAVGISLSQVWSEYKEKTSFDKPTAVSTTQFNIYAGWENHGFFADISGGYGMSSYDGERNIVIGSVSRTALSEWNGHHMGGNVRVGYGTNFGRFSLMAAASLSYLKLHEAGYVEKGVGTATSAGTGVNLVVGEQDVEFARGNLGVTMGMRFEDGTGIVEPRVRAGLTHEFSYKGPTNLAYFGFLDKDKNLPTRLSQDFMTVGELAAATTFYAGVGVDMSAHFGTLSFDYDAEFGGGRLNHIVSGTVRVSF